jgi:hypothetical protein
MKPQPIILIVVALLAFIASSAPAKVEARTSPMRTSLAKACSGLRLPIAHVRFAGDAMVFAFGYRSAGTRIAPTRLLLVLRLTVTRSGKAELLILSHHLRLAFPCRSA